MKGQEKSTLVAILIVVGLVLLMASFTIRFLMNMDLGHYTLELPQDPVEREQAIHSNLRLFLNDLGKIKTDKTCYAGEFGDLAEQKLTDRYYLLLSVQGTTKLYSIRYNDSSILHEHKVDIKGVKVGRLGSNPHTIVAGNPVAVVFYNPDYYLYHAERQPGTVVDVPALPYIQSTPSATFRTVTFGPYYYTAKNPRFYRIAGEEAVVLEPVYDEVKLQGRDYLSEQGVVDCP